MYKVTEVRSIFQVKYNLNTDDVAAHAKLKAVAKACQLAGLVCSSNQLVMETRRTQHVCMVVVAGTYTQICIYTST